MLKLLPTIVPPDSFINQLVEDLSFRTTSRSDKDKENDTIQGNRKLSLSLGRGLINIKIPPSKSG
jgi:hypothetical protein